VRHAAIYCIRVDGIEYWGGGCAYSEADGDHGLDTARVVIAGVMSESLFHAQREARLRDEVDVFVELADAIAARGGTIIGDGRRLIRTTCALVEELFSEVVLNLRQRENAVMRIAGALMRYERLEEEEIEELLGDDAVIEGA